MSYIECPYCGRRALKVATRCPHCSRPFGRRFDPEDFEPRRRIPLGLAAAGAVVVLIAVSTAPRQFRTSAGMSPPPAAKVAKADPAPSNAELEPSLRATPSPRSASSQPMAPAPSSTRPAPQLPPHEPVKVATAPTPAPQKARQALPPAPALPAAAQPLKRRYASTWVNLRARPSGRAPVVRILKPGDSLVVDSLRQGWYRAVDGGETLGYVARNLVGASPESASP